MHFLHPLSANPTKWSNTLKLFVGNLPTNWLSVFDHFVKLVLKGLNVLSLLDQRFKFSADRKTYLKLQKADIIKFSLKNYD